MDKLTTYREAVRKLLAELAGTKPSNATAVETLCVFDADTDQFLVLSVGWDGGERIHTPLVHVRLRNNKVWIEENNTDMRIAQRLVEAGIPRDDIVLGLQPPEMRRYTEYAVG
jgi:hypothetical protein